jgi:1-acyl-sn-glycerol-3-phosphate acyltransferase
MAGVVLVGRAVAWQYLGTVSVGTGQDSAAEGESVSASPRAGATASPPAGHGTRDGTRDGTRADGGTGTGGKSGRNARNNTGGNTGDGAGPEAGSPAAETAATSAAASARAGNGAAPDAGSGAPGHAEAWRAPLIWRLLMTGARFLVWCVGRLRVTGEVPASLRGTPVVVAVNHVGNFDPVVVVAAMRTRRLAPRLLATAGLFRAPVLGPVLRACGHIPVNRASASAADALHEAEAALAAGALVTLYPEGRIGLDPGMWPERGKTGLARLALRAGATVLPVAQWGAHEVVAYHGAGAMVRRFLGSVLRRPVLRVHFGAPVHLDDLSVDTPGAAMRATERIMHAVTDALEVLRTDADEMRLPRYVDPTRPLSTARTGDRRHRVAVSRPTRD